MNALEFALAIALLTAPPNKFETADGRMLFRLAAPAVRELAQEWELLDAREIDFMKCDEEFLRDVALLQNRHAQLQTAPPVADIQRFPGRELINDMIAFNRIFRDGVCKRMDLDAVHHEDLRDVLQETDHIHRVYSSLNDAQCERFSVTFRRQALAQLRNLLGPEAYYTGRLPPHVPLWRIPDAK